VLLLALRKKKWAIAAIEYQDQVEENMILKTQSLMKCR
jgi:hypothetical protein